MFLVDQISKSVVRACIPLGSSIPVLPDILHITHVQNPGAAFGLFPNATVLFIITALFVSAILLWMGKKGFDRRRMAVATGMMLGGALGNLVDRIRLGAVTDFIDLRVWPIFNFADTALTLGVLLILWWEISITPGETKGPAEIIPPGREKQL